MPETFHTGSQYYNLPTPGYIYVRFSFPLIILFCSLQRAFIGPVAGGALNDSIGFAMASTVVGSVTMAAVSVPPFTG